MIERDPDEPKVRTFETGATRSSNAGKNYYGGYLSPIAIKRFGDYMTKHRKQPDGSLRGPDNWKKGMPFREYLESGLRHFLDVWLLTEGQAGVDTQDIDEALCGLFFNTQGMLHEYLCNRGPEDA